MLWQPLAAAAAAQSSTADVCVRVPRQRRLTSEDAAELLGESEVTDNDLLPGKYEGV